MPDRRDMIIGMTAAASLGAAEFLKPRRTIRLFQGIELEDAIPRRVGAWQEYNGGNVVAPVTPDSLADRLYSATTSRVFVSGDETVPPIMLLVAYGGAQSDLLQLHRPEACYPAVGLPIAERQLGTIPLAPGAAIPATFLSAVNGGALEDIVYWTRLGEAFPQDAKQQRSARLKAAMSGVVGDGMLVRASTYRTTEMPAWPALQLFLKEMMQEMGAKARPGFVGTQLSRAIASSTAGRP